MYTNESIKGLIDYIFVRDITFLNFKNLIEPNEFSKKLHNYFYPKIKKEVCIIARHLWWHLIYPQKEYKFANKNRKFYIIVTNNTILDRQGVDVSKQRGFNQIIMNSRIHSDITVYENFIINVFFDKEIERLLDKAFLEAKNVKEFNVPRMISQVFKKRTNITMVIYKNRNIADIIRKKVLSYFHN
ncbi:MAG: hypothetical protein QXD48_00870 [Candidatus Aenigmatarchaeota archaeon]